MVLVAGLAPLGSDSISRVSPLGEVPEVDPVQCESLGMGLELPSPVPILILHENLLGCNTEQRDLGEQRDRGLQPSAILPVLSHLRDSPTGRFSEGGVWREWSSLDELPSFGRLAVSTLGRANISP